MNRSYRALAATTLLLAVPTVASALGIQIVNVSSTGASTTNLLNGDVITFDLRLENPTNLSVAGLDIVVDGFDQPNTTNAVSSGLELFGGAVARNALSTSFEPDPLNSDGLANILSAPTSVWAPNAQFPQPVRTWLFAGVDTVGRNGDGNFDNGATGGQTGPSGDIHFRVSYRLNTSTLPPASQQLLLSFGISPQWGHTAIDRFGNDVPFSNATYALTVVPEPGTALLMGLGLLGLAARRR